MVGPLRNPTTTDVQYTAEELDFMRALECYRRENHRPFPTCREILAVAESLGYRRVCEPVELPRFGKGPCGGCR